MRWSSGTWKEKRFFIRKHPFIFLISLLGYSCSPQEPFKISQSESNHPVIVHKNSSGKIHRIDFPFYFEYENNSGKPLKVYDVDYFYSGEYGRELSLNKHQYLEGWLSNVRLYSLSEGERRPIGGGSYEPFDEKIKDQKLLVYSMHKIDTTAPSQAEFSIYLDKMEISQTDTLTVGSFSAFKNKHPLFTELILKDDSISFRIMNKDLRLEELIHQPVIH